jgi:transposase
VVERVEEIDDEQHERVLDRVCAIDVAKESGQVCVRASRADGRRYSKVWMVRATTRAILALGEQLVRERVEKVTLESTSDYWRIWFYLLEACELDVQLINARDIKNVPGRPKTDKLDCVWQAKLTERGMLRPSFVPPRPVRVLRDYTRMRTDLIRDRTRQYQRLEKLLEDSLIKVTSVASTMTTVSVRDMVNALVRGERDPRALAGLARGRMRDKHDALVEALTGQFDEHHAELAQILLGQIDGLDIEIGRITARINKLIAGIPEMQAPETDSDDGESIGHEPTGDDPITQQPPAVPGRRGLPAVQRLAQIPGISIEGAQTILAEIGPDMTRFPTAGHLVSWARLCPRTIQSGAKHKTGKTPKGNPYLKGVLGQAAGAAAKTNTFLGERYRRLVKRRGKGKALVAVARSILIAVWHVLANPATRFRDLGPDYYTTRTDKERRIRNHVRQIEALGYTVTVAPAA